MTDETKDIAAAAPLQPSADKESALPQGRDHADDG